MLVNQFNFSLKETAAVTTFHKICALLASMAIIPLAKHGRDVNLMVLSGMGVGLRVDLFLAKTKSKLQKMSTVA